MHALTDLEICKLLGLFNRLMIYSQKIRTNWPKQFDSLTFPSFFTHLIHDQYESSFIKQLIMKLLEQIHICSEKKVVNSLNLINNTLSDYKPIIIEKYYLEIALSQYRKRKDEGLMIKGDILGFYQLPLETKVDLLAILAKSINFPKITSKRHSQLIEEQEDGELYSSKQMRRLTKNHILGDDGENIYMYSQYIPYILRFKGYAKDVLNKSRTRELIKHLLKQPKENNTIFLIENLDYVLPKLADNHPNQEFKIQNMAESLDKEKLLENFKALLKNIQSDYERFLKKYLSLYYAPLNERIQLKKKILSAQSTDDLIFVFSEFYQKSKNLFSLRSMEEDDLPDDLVQQRKLYSQKKTNKALFHQNAILIMFKKPKSMSIERLVKLVMNKALIDRNSIFEITLIIVSQAIQNLVDQTVKKNQLKIKKYKTQRVQFLDSGQIKSQGKSRNKDNFNNFQEYSSYYD